MTDRITELPIPERLALISNLWNSIVAEIDDPGLSAEQTAEVERRLADLDSGRVQTLSLHEAEELLGWDA